MAFHGSQVVLFLPGSRRLGRVWPYLPLFFNSGVCIDLLGAFLDDEGHDNVVSENDTGVCSALLNIAHGACVARSA